MLIPLDEITAEAKSILKDATDHDRLLFRQWAVTALKQLGPTKDNVEIATLYPIDYSMKKPDDCSSAIDIALFTSGDLEIKAKYKSGAQRIHTRTDRNLRDGLYSYSEGFPVEISEDDYYFNLSTNSNNVAYAILRYYKLPIGDDGLPMIPEVYREAIIQFIRWRWQIRQNENQSAIAQARQDWLIERGTAKGNAKMPSMLEAKTIMNDWVSMIGKNFKDNF